MGGLRILSRMALMLIMCLGAGCTSRHEKNRDIMPSPIIADEVRIRESETLVILIPGALAPISIFDQAADWEEAGYALAFYRFPGLDGRDPDEKVIIEDAANQIADFANSYPEKSIRLLGYSTGGPIALIAATKIKNDDIKIAAIAPAVPSGGGLPTLLRGVADIADSALRAGSLNRQEVWLEYYKLLLYGRKGLKMASLEEKIRAEAEAARSELIVPDRRLSQSHTGDLRSWRPKPADLPQKVETAFFIGLEDPVFSTGQTLKFVDMLAGVTVYGYPDQGHLLHVTTPRVFRDILRFFEGKPVIVSEKEDA